MTYKELEKRYRETSPEQFPTFMHFIKNAKNTGELSSLEATSLLCKLADSEIEECRRTGRKGMAMDENERRYLAMTAKLLACSLVFLCESRTRKETRIRALQFLELSSYLNSNKYDLTGLGINCGCYAMVSPGFSWSTIETSIGTDILIYKMIGHARFDKNYKLEEITTDRVGSLYLKDGKLHISSAQTWETETLAFSNHNETIEIYTRNIRDERLKASNIDDILPVENFASNFILTQDESKKSKPQKTENELVCYGKYSIAITREIKNDEGPDYLECTPLMTLHEGSCEINEEELVKGIYTHELIEYLYDQDVIENAELIDMEEPMLFSIKEAYKKYCRKQAEADIIQKRVYEAKVIDIYKGSIPEKDRVRLISDKGYPGLMRVNGDYQKGDTVIVNTAFIQPLGSELYINMEKPAYGYYDTPERFDGESILEDFTVTKEEALANLNRKSMTADKSPDLLERILQPLSSIISLSKACDSMERLRNLLSAAFILNIVDDIDGRNALLSRAGFLGQCLRVAESIPVRENWTSPRLDEKEKWIINALGFIDRHDDITDIASLLKNASDEEEKEIARLLMIHSLSHSSPDYFKYSPEDIRKQICGILGVSDHFRGPENKGGGKYGKGELANVEFKASYVMSNKDGKPDIYYQGRGQVFEAVCGFMNRDGGTVYIGVNNYGDPLTAEGYGIKGDLDWFRKNFDTVKLTRANQLKHPVPQPEDFDSYCRFLNDEVELYFKPSVRNCITISPTDDMDAIRIDVRPSEFEIVKLYEDNTWTEGTAYVRNGEETVPMSRHDQEQRLMKLRSVGKVEQFILILNEAIDRKRKVILKGYSSSNSNQVKDRIVVPINLVYNNENLWAYDLEKGETKEFRLSRIAEIDTDIENACYPHDFKKGEADVFRWINPHVNYHIKLKMSIAALNYLQEEYSEAKNISGTELYRISSGKWILDTTLHGLGAVRRFYLGLADHIEIMDTEDADKLREEIRRFTEKNLSLQPSSDALCHHG